MFPSFWRLDGDSYANRKQMLVSPLESFLPVGWCACFPSLCCCSLWLQAYSCNVVQGIALGQWKSPGSELRCPHLRPGSLGKSIKAFLPCLKAGQTAVQIIWWTPHPSPCLSCCSHHPLDVSWGDSLHSICMQSSVMGSVSRELNLECGLGPQDI